MHLADTLSRAYLETTDGRHEDFENVNATKFVAISESRLDSIRKATESDSVMSKLKEMILKGWPDEKIHVPMILHPYFIFRDELAIHEGLLFRGERVIIPTSERAMMKEKIHSSHLGMEGCLRRAREFIYWPNMTQEIKDYISKCEICRTFEIANPKEPLISHEIPDRPWAKIGTDIFTIHDKNYLITVDYYSNFWEVDYLPDMNSKTIIGKLKTHLARYGIPDQIISDNGPQYISKEFQDFCNKWDIEHLTSSPYNSKSNGKAESAVKTAKRIMRKCKESRSDPYLAFLDHRNTPSQGMLSSPAQRLMSRRTKTILPTAPSLLRPEVVDAKYCKRDIKSRQDKHNAKYHPSAELPILQEGDTVRLQPFKLGEKKWQKGTVINRLDQRSYLVDTDSGMLRRNRQHLKKTNEPNTHQESSKEIRKEIPPMSSEPEVPNSPIREATMKERDVTVNKSPNIITTRSGRQIRVPLRYQE